MLKTKKPYQDIGPERYNEQFKERQLKHLQRKAKEYGYVLAPLQRAPIGAVN
jgi:hypothetical protein